MIRINTQTGFYPHHNTGYHPIRSDTPHKKADASKSHAVSSKRLLEIETQLRKEVSELFALGEQVDQGETHLPEGVVIQDEIASREERLATLAKAVLEARAKERYEAEKAEYEARLREPPGAEPSPKEKMAYKLQTEIGKAIYRLRKSTLEPVIGIIKKSLGFRPFSLRSWWAAATEWGLGCLAFNLKRRHTLSLAQDLI